MTQTAISKEAAEAAADILAKAARRKPKMLGVPTDAGPDYLRMWHTLRRLAARGCERLTPPSTCRAANGYPEAEWCEGCIAAEGLGLDREWFQLR